MAEKVDKTAAVLPLSTEGETKKNKQARADLDLSPSVRGVILWTLFHAGNITVSFAFSAAYCMLIDTIFSSSNNPPPSEHLPAPAAGQPPPSWLLPRAVEMTGAEATVVHALVVGMLWCAVPQVAAGVLAPMLPSHRRRLRLLLAYAGLAATVAGHCMLARVIRMIVAADPGGLFLRTVGTVAIFNLGVDLLYFLVLVLRGGEEE